MDVYERHPTRKRIQDNAKHLFRYKYFALIKSKSYLGGNRLQRTCNFLVVEQFLSFSPMYLVCTTGIKNVNHHCCESKA